MSAMSYKRFDPQEPGFSRHGIDASTKAFLPCSQFFFTLPAEEDEEIYVGSVERGSI